jgi:hypothetical protein
VLLTRYVTLSVQIEVPDELDQAEQDVLVDDVMENALFDFNYDNGDGTRTVDGPIFHSYSDEVPE